MHECQVTGALRPDFLRQAIDSKGRGRACRISGRTSAFAAVGSPRWQCQQSSRLLTVVKFGAPRAASTIDNGHQSAVEYQRSTTDKLVASRLKNLSQRNPSSPAEREATRIAIFEALIKFTLLGNARLTMKIDIVKPMPPKRAAPRM